MELKNRLQTKIPEMRERTSRLLRIAQDTKVSEVTIGQVFGGRVVRARKVMHGKTSPIYHADTGVFTGLDNPFEATRYHSLVIEWETLPECLEVTAWTHSKEGDMDEIMGVRHKDLAVQGVQFHPESILTRQGHDLLRNFIEGR